MRDKVIVVIIKAGDVGRIEFTLPIVMQKICGQPIIEYLIGSALEVSDRQSVVILDNDNAIIPPIQGYLRGHKGYVVLMADNIPLVQGHTLKRLIEYSREGNYDGVFLGTCADNTAQASVCCCYAPALAEAMSEFDHNKSKPEYHLSHMLDTLTKAGKKIGVYTEYEQEETMGINTYRDQAKAQEIMKQRINGGHLDNGVVIIDPNNTYIGPNVKIGKDATIYPGNILEGHTTIEEGAILYQNNRIVDSRIGKEAQIQSSVVLESRVGNGTSVGPFSYIRPGSQISSKVRVGCFVEIKNSNVGEGSKVSHLTYVGDGDVGKNVNIGCGVVFVNYDGKKKHRTIVEDNAFIGCNVNLVSPVTVENDSYIAAGSTITRDVPPGALSIARAQQVNKEGWVEKHKNETEDN
ncbi:MAG: bifunctional UDP-N-acetylglucosamine diphosphorylase/glucosamine-1-phosphate N-acetyltransferase GlmU [Clostridiales bacterium]|nr:bifunctional UDP-N-acetylglucosamine diphosphorylase/glucosamine-1-phosphate N-acetyltransferase GlmU [Clostridiales bacterium]